MPLARWCVCPALPTSQASRRSTWWPRIASCVTTVSMTYGCAGNTAVGGSPCEGLNMFESVRSNMKQFWLLWTWKCKVYQAVKQAFPQESARILEGTSWVATSLFSTTVDASCLGDHHQLGRSHCAFAHRLPHTDAKLYGWGKGTTGNSCIYQRCAMELTWNDVTWIQQKLFEVKELFM